MLRITIISSLLAALVSVAMMSSTQAGNYRYTDDRGFILFDLFSTAPDSIYRRPHRRTKGARVKGFKKRVGGYSYRYQDVLPTTGRKPFDFNPIFDRDTFSGRIGVDGPYVGE